MDNYTIYGALFESMVRKELIRMYLDNGATIDEAERWVNNTQLQVVNGFLFATTQDGFIYTYSISTLISLHALIPTPEIENHNEALKTKLLNTDFSKL